MTATSPWTVVLAWAAVSVTYEVPQWLTVDWPSPLGGAFPGERVWFVVLLALIGDFAYRHAGNRRWFAAVLCCAGLALTTAFLPRIIHHPILWALQLALAGQFWAWAANARSDGIAGVALVQTVHAVIIFPAVQLAYGAEVQSGTTSPIVAIGAAWMDALFTLAAATIVGFALNRDLRRLGV